MIWLCLVTRYYSFAQQRNWVNKDYFAVTRHANTHSILTFKTMSSNRMDFLQMCNKFTKNFNCKRKEIDKNDIWCRLFFCFCFCLCFTLCRLLSGTRKLRQQYEVGWRFIGYLHASIWVTLFTFILNIYRNSNMPFAS